MQGFGMMLKAMGIDPAKIEAQAGEVAKVLGEVRGRFDSLSGDLGQILRNQADHSDRLAAIEAHLSTQGFVPPQHAAALLADGGLHPVVSELVARHTEQAEQHTEQAALTPPGA